VPQAWLPVFTTSHRACTESPAPDLAGQTPLGRVIAVVTARCPPCDVVTSGHRVGPTAGTTRFESVTPTGSTFPVRRWLRWASPSRFHAVCLHLFRRAVFPDPWVAENHQRGTALIGLLETAGDPFQLAQAPNQGRSQIPAGRTSSADRHRRPLRPNRSPATPGPTETSRLDQCTYVSQTTDVRPPPNSQD
jgi:hypothetical protein